MRTRVAFCDRERAERNVDRRDLQILPLAFDGDGDTSAPRSDVEHARSVWRTRDRRFDEQLRLQPRNEHAIVDEEFASEELRLSADVLQRLAVDPPSHQSLDGRRIDA